MQKSAFSPVQPAAAGEGAADKQSQHRVGSRVLGSAKVEGFVCERPKKADESLSKDSSGKKRENGRILEAAPSKDSPSPARDRQPGRPVGVVFRGHHARPPGAKRSVEATGGTKRRS